MGFRKPFRAAPVRLGPYYRQEERRRALNHAAKVLGWAAALGLLAGMASTEAGRAKLAALLQTANAPATLTREHNPPVGAYYPGCNAARAAGVAPLLAGEPGYRPEMDGDGDGIACEPYYGS
jgi:hypothetical protein